jgi:hypothetical protein
MKELHKHTRFHGNPKPKRRLELYSHKFNDNKPQTEPDTS